MVEKALKKFLSCVTIAATAFFSVGCEKDYSQAEWWQGEQERVSLSQELQLKKYRLGQVDAHGFEELEGLRNATAATTSSLRSLRQQRLTLNDEVASLEGKWGEFREATIRNQRHRAIGKTFEAIHLVSGRQFQDVTVAAIDDAGVTIRHADGSARLRFADLDSEQQVFFGLEADLALAATDKEAEAIAVYERWIDNRMASIHEQERKDSEITRREELAARELRSQLASTQVAASKTRALAQAATPVGNQSWGNSSDYSTFRTYRPTYRYIYYYVTPSYQSSCPAVVPTRTGGTGCVSPYMTPTCQPFTDTIRHSIP